HRGTLQVDAYSRDDLTKLDTGTLLTIDNQIDQTTGTGKLKAIFENKTSELWPNQFVNIHLLLETQKNVTVVPSAAVQRGPQGNYVYVMKPDKTVEVRNVNIPVTQGNLSEIASGVSPNELVVTDGKDKLQQGSHVEPHTQGSGTQNAEGASPDQNATNAPPNPGQAQSQGGRRGNARSNNGNQQRGNASQ